MTRGGVSAKMKNKNTWSIPDIAALADYFGVPVTSLLDDTLMRQMLGEGNLGASLVAATTARFPVRAAEGQADGLKPLETKRLRATIPRGTRSRWVPPERVELSLSD